MHHKIAIDTINAYNRIWQFALSQLPMHTGESELRSKDTIKWMHLSRYCQVFFIKMFDEHDFSNVVTDTWVWEMIHF